jgi:hypothetical protein
MKQDSKNNNKGKSKKTQSDEGELKPNKHLGSSNAFEETENPLSRDPDNISDEMLDELIGDE